MSTRPGRILLILLILLSGSDVFSLDESSYALQLFRQEKYYEAAIILEKAAAGNRASSSELAVLGLCYIKLNKLDQAEEVLQTALKKSPSSSIVQLAFGNLRFTQKNFDQAYICFKRAAEIDPGSIEARKGMAASLVNRGVDNFTRGKFDEARKDLDEALKIDPQYVPALRTLAALDLETGNPHQALKLLKKAQSTAPEDPVTQVLLVNALEEIGDRKELITALEKLTRLQPLNPEPWVKLGLIFEQMGEEQKAQKAFTEAVHKGTDEPYPHLLLSRLNEDVNLAYLAIGKAVMQASMLRVQAARTVEQDIEKIKYFSDRVIEPLKILEESLVLLERLRACRKDFIEDIVLLTEWYPHSVELKETLADLYSKESRWQAALDQWEEIIRRYPLNSKAQLGRAHCLEMSGKLNQAALGYRRALDIDPKNVEIYHSLFKIYRTLGRETELLDLLKELSLRDRRNTVLKEMILKLSQGLNLDF